MDKIPMKRHKLYTEQINAKVTREVKEQTVQLKRLGVDVGELVRSAISRAIEEAFNGIAS